jgi:predicted transcriptional regulator
VTASPTVLRAMTPFPLVIAPDATWIAARALMRGHDIRHLPVVDGDQVVGLISLAELELAKRLTGREDHTVRALCVRDPVRVAGETPLKEAIRLMAERGADAAVVERRGRLAGVLTLTDIGDLLLSLLPGPFVDQGGPRA